MFFHLPPSIQWDPVSLCTDLVHRETDATVDASEINLSLSSDSCDAWRERHARQIARRERVTRGTTWPHASIRYYPDRFLRNLELRRDVFKVPLTEPQLQRVEESVRAIGAISIDSADTEFGIAYRHCSDHAAIDELRREIEHLLQRKQRYIDQRNFQAAADTRDTECDVRARLDTLLFHTH